MIFLARSVHVCFWGHVDKLPIVGSARWRYCLYPDFLIFSPFYLQFYFGLLKFFLIILELNNHFSLSEVIRLFLGARG